MGVADALLSREGWAGCLDAWENQAHGMRPPDARTCLAGIMGRPPGTRWMPGAG